MVSSNTGFCGIKRQKSRESQEKKACKKLILVVTMMDRQQMITFIPQVCLFLSARQPKSAGNKSYQCLVGKTRGRIA